MKRRSQSRSRRKARKRTRRGGIEIKRKIHSSRIIEKRERREREPGEKRIKLRKGRILNTRRYLVRVKRLPRNR